MESKGLEAITSPISTELRNGKQYYTYTKEDVEIIEKELKALEAIKEEFEISFNDKKQTIQFESIEEPYTYIRFSLTREIKDKDKYNLLKEALK